MKYFILSLIISFVFFGSDSTKVKPNLRYKKITKQIDSAEIKIKQLQFKIDSLKQNKKFKRKIKREGEN